MLLESDQGGGNPTLYGTVEWILTHSTNTGYTALQTGLPTNSILYFLPLLASRPLNYLSYIELNYLFACFILSSPSLSEIAQCTANFINKISEPGAHVNRYDLDTSNMSY